MSGRARDMGLLSINETQARIARELGFTVHTHLSKLETFFCDERMTREFTFAQANERRRQGPAPIKALRAVRQSWVVPVAADALRFTTGLGLKKNYRHRVVEYIATTPGWSDDFDALDRLSPTGDTQKVRRLRWCLLLLSSLPKQPSKEATVDAL